MRLVRELTVDGRTPDRVGQYGWPFPLPDSYPCSASALAEGTRDLIG